MCTKHMLLFLAIYLRNFRLHITFDVLVFQAYFQKRFVCMHFPTETGLVFSSCIELGIFLIQSRDDNYLMATCQRRRQAVKRFSPVQVDQTYSTAFTTP
jgi:hypothetical protein